MLIELLFWWTGFVVWAMAAVLFVVVGLPDGDAFRGVTRLTFYNVGPVIWRVLPENRAVFDRLKEVGYHFLRIGGDWHLGLALPTWLSRLLYGSRQ